MSQWVLFKLYDPKNQLDRRVLVNLDRVERIRQSPDGTHYEAFTVDGRLEKIVTTADELLLITTAQVLAP
jgi:hypothetical protein